MVSRDGEHRLVDGPLSGSVQKPNEYGMRTTPIPPGESGIDWLGYFNSQLTGLPFSGYHGGDKITVDCWPDNELRLVDTVDAAIEYANEQVK